MKFTQGKTPVGEHMHIDCCCSEHAFEIMNRFCSKKVFAPEDIVIFLDEDDDLMFALPFTWYEIQKEMEDYSDDATEATWEFLKPFIEAMQKEMDESLDNFDKEHNERYCKLAERFNILCGDYDDLHTWYRRLYRRSGRVCNFPKH